MSLGKVAKVLQFLGLGDRESETQLLAITKLRSELSELTDAQLRARPKDDLIVTFALTAVVAERLLSLRMFDVQILGALALQRGDIAEMQTGEGKTLAAVPTVIWLAMQHRGVHILR